jgi:hypothetical protein
LLLRRCSSALHTSLVLTWNMILFEAKYHFKKAIFIETIFLWNVFLFGAIWFTNSSNKMSTLDTIVMTRTSCWGTVKGKLLNIYIKNCHMIVLYMITCFGTTFEMLTEKESLQGPTTLYGRLSSGTKLYFYCFNYQIYKILILYFYLIFFSHEIIIFRWFSNEMKKVRNRFFTLTENKNVDHEYDRPPYL